MDPMIIFRQMLIILLLIMIGYYCQKTGHISPENKKCLSWLTINVFNPAMILTSVMNGTPPGGAEMVLLMFILAAAMFLSCILLAALLAPLQGRTHEDRIQLRLMYVFSNLSFIGIPVIRALLGDDYVLYVAIFNLMYSVFFYSYGYSVVGGGKLFSLQTLKQMLNIGTLSSILALVLFFTKPQLPVLVTGTVGYISGPTTMMALMIIGVTLGEQESILEIFKSGKVYLFTLIRMILYPFISCVIIHLLPVPEEAASLAVILYAMPVGSVPMLLLTEREMEGKFCSDGIMMTTVVSVFTIPLVITLFQML